MRGSYRLVAGSLFTVVCAALVAPAAGHAQEAHLFQNSWFWGVHAGTTSIGTPGKSSSYQGTLGGEWMITRSRGGLYVSYDQASFNRTGQVADANGTGGIRNVAIHNMRTTSIAGVAFPVQLGNVRPYAGLGFAISLVGDATPMPDPLTEAGATTATVTPDVQNRIDDGRSRAGVFFIGGAQWQVHRTALFGQMTAMPSADQFLITSSITTFSVGVRYNFGSSIDR